MGTRFWKDKGCSGLSLAVAGPNLFLTARDPHGLLAEHFFEYQGIPNIPPKVCQEYREQVEEFLDLSAMLR